MSFEAALETEHAGSTLLYWNITVMVPGANGQISKIIIQDNYVLPTVEYRSCFQTHGAALLCNRLQLFSVDGAFVAPAFVFCRPATTTHPEPQTPCQCKHANSSESGIVVAH